MISHLHIKFVKAIKISKEDEMLIKLAGIVMTLEELHRKAAVLMWVAGMSRSDGLLKFNSLSDNYYFTTEDVYLTCCNIVVVAGTEFEFVEVVEEDE